MEEGLGGFELGGDPPRHGAAARRTEGTRRVMVGLNAAPRVGW
jgi:hypothetical protein